MTLYVLNETARFDAPGDMTVFCDLATLGIGIERQDVDAGEYSIFDTAGSFYHVASTSHPDRFLFTPRFSDPILAERLVRELLRREAVTLGEWESLEEPLRPMAAQPHRRSDSFLRRVLKAAPWTRRGGR